jgi:hypothetical protein
MSSDAKKKIFATAQRLDEKQISGYFADACAPSSNRIASL